MKTSGEFSLVMSISELASAMGISRGLAYTLARQNNLPVPVIYIGRRRMVVSRAAVLRMLDVTSATATHE